MSASKTKKGLSSAVWFSCDSCGCYVSHKELQEHQQNNCAKLDSSEINLFSWKQFFIKNQCLHGFMEEYKSTGPLNVDSEDVILVSQSAMQLCQFVIGDPVIVISKTGEGNCVDSKGRINSHCEVKTIWPTSEGSITSVFCPKRGMEMSWGLNFGVVKVMKLKSIPIPASEVIFNFTKPTDIPEKIDSFINLLRYQMLGKVYHSNSRIAIDFYGKRIKLIVLKIEPLKMNKIGDCVDDLTCDFDMKLNTKEVNDSNVDCVSGYHDSTDVQFYKMFENTKWCLKRDTDNAVSSANEYKLNMNDVGGYKDILNDLHSLMINCLRTYGSDNHHKYMGIRSSKGVLLYGLHGVGKTLVAHALANSTKAYVVRVQSGDLFSKYYGEAETRLRSLFEEASMNTPSVIILDDIDTLCSKRGGSDQERRVIATLLSLLDSIVSYNVFVIATTSQLHMIDPALRRPGRLDREIELPVPCLADREDILMKMLKRPELLCEDDVIQRIAAIAHGYVGADLSAVVAHAIAQAAQLNNNIIAGDVLDWALTQVKPSAMREVYVRVPNVKWSDIGGQDNLKLQLRQAVEWPLNHPDAFARLGITPPRGILMFGPPGCSKTMIAKALATESKLNFISIKGPELFSKWVGESERAVRDVFKRARSVAPSIVFLDELDAIAGERGDGDGSGGSASVQERVLAQLLTELDGVEPLRNVIIVAATNRPDRIDKALMRPGRLDRLIYVPLPDLATRRQILQLQFRKTPVSSDVNVDELVALMNGYSGAEVVAVCHEAALNALDEDSSASQVKLCHFKYALNIVTPRTPDSLLDLYRRYVDVGR